MISRLSRRNDQLKFEIYATITVERNNMSFQFRAIISCDGSWKYFHVAWTSCRSLFEFQARCQRSWTTFPARGRRTEETTRLKWCDWDVSHSQRNNCRALKMQLFFFPWTIWSLRDGETSKIFTTSSEIVKYGKYEITYVNLLNWVPCSRPGEEQFKSNWKFAFLMEKQSSVCVDVTWIAWRKIF